MIFVLYYTGLVACSTAVTLTNFANQKWQSDWIRFIEYLIALYPALGWYLFGWKLGIANIGILVVVGGILDQRIVRFVKRTWPQASYRDPLSEKWLSRVRWLHAKIRIGGA